MSEENQNDSPERLDSQENEGKDLLSLNNMITDNPDLMNSNIDLNNLPDENNNQENQMMGMDDIITNNAELLNAKIELNDEYKKDQYRSNENEPLSKKSNISEIINIPINEKDENTLNESILTTIYRDFYLIYTKLKFVVMPYVSPEKKQYHIKQWDLWGPLILNLLLACTLAINSEEKSQMIILVFVIFWLGGTILFLNANFLGVKSSIFQIFCLLGYCLFPLNLSAIIVTIIKFNDVIKFIIVGITCLWSIYTSGDFLKSITYPDQRYLVLYPCCLFYLYISWFIISTNN